MSRPAPRTRCPECQQWRRVTLVHGDQWHLDQHERPAFRGSTPCPWRPGLVHTSIVLRGVVVRPALERSEVTS